MADSLTRADIDYILASLRYAHYAQDQIHYRTEFLRHRQAACLEEVEAKLKAMRDALGVPDKPKDEEELF